MTATADLPNKNIKLFTEKFSFAAWDKSIIIDSEDWDKIKLIAKTLMKWDTWAKAVSVAFVGDNMVFTLDDLSTVTLTDAKVDLKWDQWIQWNPWADGTDWATITSAAFVWNNLVFTLDDASTVTITNAKIDLKGDQWIQWEDGTNGIDWTSFVREWAYSAWTTYQVNDTVSYNGSSYICILESTGNLPTNETYWSLLAAKWTDWAWAWDMLASVYDPTPVAGDAFDMDNMAQWDTNKFVSAAELTVLQNTSWTNTWDETTTTLWSKINWATEKNTPVDADMFWLMDSAASNILKKLSWANIKATLKTYFDTLYQTILSKATWVEVDNWTDDAKFVTSKAIADSKLSYTDWTETLTNKRITPRVSSETSSATPTINTDNVDAHSITALWTDITSMTTNLSWTPTNFQKLIIRIKDNWTSRNITWWASFEAKWVSLPTATTISKVLTVWFIYDTVTSKRGCVASAEEA